MKGHYEIIINDNEFVIKSGLSMIEGEFLSTPEQATYRFNCTTANARMMFDIAKEVYKIINNESNKIQSKKKKRQ